MRNLLILLTLLAVGGGLYWWSSGADEKTVIQRRILEAIQILDVQEVQVVQIQKKATALLDFVTPDFTAEVKLANGSKHAIPNVAELRSSLVGLMFVLKPFLAEAYDFNIEVEPDRRRAQAKFTVDLKHLPRAGIIQRSNVSLSLAKQDGVWLIEIADCEVLHK